MSTDPSSKAKASEDFYRDVNRLTPTAVAYCSGMLFMAGVLMFLWFDGKPGHPMYGLLVAMWTFSLGPGMAIPVMLRLPPGWFRVPAGERVLHACSAWACSAGYSHAPDTIAASSTLNGGFP